MPIRTASFKKRLADNGKALHRAMADRTKATGADKPKSEAETALIEERQLLKEQREERRAKAKQPSPSALDRLVRTRRPEAKEKTKVEGDASQPAKETKKPKAQKTRAEKQADQAAALDAQRKSPKKPPAK